MPFTISLTEYKMLHPDTAEVPTLSQNGMLAALLQKRQLGLARLARRQAKRHARRQAVRACLRRWWTMLRGNASPHTIPVFAAADARSL